MGINKVVKTTKKIDSPSTPKGKLIFSTGTHKSFSTNWKVPMDLLKKTNKKSDIMNVAQEQLNAIYLNNFLLDDGIMDKLKTPIKGNIKINDNIFVKFNIIIKVIN